MYKTFSAWYNSQLRQERTKVALVLHTSCVNYEDALLKQMEQIPACWILPHSVRCELRLLAEGAVFHRQAIRILRRAEEDERKLGLNGRWELEALYRDRSGSENLEDLYQGMLVFWFGDLNKQDEFLWNVRRLRSQQRILMLNSWDCSGSGDGVRCVNDVREISFRRCQALSKGAPAGPVEQITIVDGTGARFSGKELKAVGLSGTNAAIYESSRFPDSLIKIYKQKVSYGNQVRKLERLCQLQHFAGAERELLRHLALPEQLLRTPQGDVVGYTMRKCPGRRLRDYRVIGWKGHDQVKILHQLLSILLHLHTMRVLVNDLSYNNVLVDEDDWLSLVDCDSFQVFHFPGGGITEPFRHPQVDAACAAHMLREPRHEYFALAVLLYQFLFHGDPLPPQPNAANRNINWNNSVFPLDVHGKIQGGPMVNACVLREWKRCPETLRRLFCDEFHFRADHSFGAWIDALGLIGLDGG